MESSHRTGNDWINNNNKDVCHNITLVVLYCFVDTYDCLWLWLFNVPVEKPVKSRLYLVYSFETLDCEKKHGCCLQVYVLESQVSQLWLQYHHIPAGVDSNITYNSFHILIVFKHVCSISMDL